MRGVRWTAAMRNRLVEMRAAGHTYKTIAEALGCTVAAAKCMRKSLCLPRRAKVAKPSRNPKKPAGTKERIDRMMQLAEGRTA